jgi:hypothetical protein
MSIENLDLNNIIKGIKIHLYSTTEMINQIYEDDRYDTELKDEMSNLFAEHSAEVIRKQIILLLDLSSDTNDTETDIRFENILKDTLCGRASVEGIVKIIQTMYLNRLAEEERLLEHRNAEIQKKKIDIIGSQVMNH